MIIVRLACLALSPLRYQVYYTLKSLRLSFYVCYTPPGSIVVIFNTKIMFIASTLLVLIIQAAKLILYIIIYFYIQSTKSAARYYYLFSRSFFLSLFSINEAIILRYQSLSMFQLFAQLIGLMTLFTRITTPVSMEVHHLSIVKHNANISYFKFHQCTLTDILIPQKYLYLLF